MKDPFAIIAVWSCFRSIDPSCLPTVQLLSHSSRGKRRNFIYSNALSDYRTLGGHQSERRWVNFTAPTECAYSHCFSPLVVSSGSNLSDATSRSHPNTGFCRVAAVGTPKTITEINSTNTMSFIAVLLHSPFK